MVLLDTNVLSELMRPAPSARVVAWAADQPSRSVYLTSVTVAEVAFGVLLLPAGKRRAAIAAAAAAMIEVEFAGRVLAFGIDEATVYAQIAADRRRAGRAISHFDAQIAAIARVAGATLATRNVADFHGCGIKLVDPWAGKRL